MSRSIAEALASAAEGVARAARRVAEEQADAVERLIDDCTSRLRDGGKCLVLGNGGSAAQAQHFAAELVNRYERDRAALPAVSLAADGSLLTSVANDSDFRRIFARQIEALARPGDWVLAFSTSGASPNVVEALHEARRRGVATAAILGRDGGAARGLADVEIVIPARRTDRIQEVQLMLAHLICQEVERRLGLVAEPPTPVTSTTRRIAESTRRPANRRRAPGTPAAPTSPR